VHPIVAPEEDLPDREGYKVRRSVVPVEIRAFSLMLKIGSFNQSPQAHHSRWGCLTKINPPLTGCT